MKMRWIFAGAFAAAVVLSTGCSETKEVGKSTKQLVTGQVDNVIARSPEQVSEAIDGTIADLKLMRINSSSRTVSKQTETNVIARNSQDVKITFTYRKVDEKNTRLGVTTGMFGDSTLRQQVWDQLRTRLGLLKVVPVATTPAGATPATQPSQSTASTADDFRL